MSAVADTNAPRSFDISWPPGAGPVEVREFVDTGVPVREVRLGGGEWERFGVDVDIELAP